MSDLADIRAEVCQLELRLDELRSLLREAGLRDSMPPGPPSALLCQVGEQRVGVPLSQVEQVLMMCELAPIPESPAWISGLLNFHGTLIPVIDIWARTHEGQRPSLFNDSIVVCSTGSGPLAIIVQGTERVVTFEFEAIGVPPEELPIADYLFGVFELLGEPIFLLNLARLQQAYQTNDGEP